MSGANFSAIGLKPPERYKGSWNCPVSRELKLTSAVTHHFVDSRNSSGTTFIHLQSVGGSTTIWATLAEGANPTQSRPELYFSSIQVIQYSCCVSPVQLHSKVLHVVPTTDPIHCHLQNWQ